MQTIHNFIVRFGLWLARYGGWKPEPPCLLPHLPLDPQIDIVRGIVKDINIRYPGNPGPLKSREALRVLLNLWPNARERDLNLLIELALQ